jgi:predicted permease
VIRDVRHAWRAIRRMPVVSTVVVVSLAIGIAANTVVFSWIEAVVLRPIPGVRGAGQFHSIEPRTDIGIYAGSSWLEYQDLKERLRLMPDLLAFRMAPLYVGEPGQVERGNSLLVSANYFSALGLRPALGRFFRPDEVRQPGREPVVVISDVYWQTRFVGAPAVVGQSMRINGQDMTIVGVAPRGFQGTLMRLTFDLWLPATLAPVLLSGSQELQDRNIRAYTVLGRLDSGSRDQAQSEVDAAMRELGRLYPQTNTALQAEVLPLGRAPRGPQRLLATSLAILQGFMLLLLLTVCGNTANLMLTRACARQREMSVRLALGAGRWRVVSLLLTENIILALAGAAMGAALAIWGTSLLSALPPMRVRGIPITFQTSVSGMGLVFAMALGLGCGLIFGIAPALHLARVDPQTTIRAGSSTARRSLMRNGLMAAEVALALIVLVVAGLSVQRFMETRTTDTGFTRDGVLLTSYDLVGRVDDGAARQFAARLLDRLRTLPGVEAAAIASAVPLDIHGLPIRFFTLEGRARTDGTIDQALTNTVTPGYFDVMRIPFRAGADFAKLDDTAAPPQAIVNDEFVRRYINGGEPIGRRLSVRGRTYTITGVVRTSLYNAFGEPPTPIIYFSYRDRPSTTGEMHMRTRPGAETAIARDVRRTVRDLDAELPVYDVRTLNDHIEANLIFRRVPARMFVVLGPLLLVLASIGIYAVVAYSVSLRTIEIGVRVALGASSRRVVGHFVGESLVVIGAGALVGWTIAAAIAMLGSDAPLDARVFAGVPALLLLVATLASWLPAWHATSVDPVVALREE